MLWSFSIKKPSHLKKGTLGGDNLSGRKNKDDDVN